MSLLTISTGNPATTSSSSLFLNTYMNDFMNSQGVINRASRTSSATSTSQTVTNVTCDTCDPGEDETPRCGVDDDKSLQLRVKYLEEELKSVQADKDFVWSLWKQLQSSSPDMTSAIALVVKREKEKSESKDQKVLEILRCKDDQLAKLNKRVDEKDAECKRMSGKLDEMESRLLAKEDELTCFKLNIKTIQDKDQMYEQMLRLRDDKHASRVKELESAQETLASRLREISEECEYYKQSDAKLKVECDQQRKSCDMLKKQVEQGNENYQKLLNELNQFRLSIDHTLKVEVDKLSVDVKQRDDLIDTLKRQLAETNLKLNCKDEFIAEQEKIIKQLRSIHIDLQKSNKSEKDTYRILMNENESLKHMYEQVNTKYEECLANEKLILNENQALKRKCQQQQALSAQQMKLNEKCINDLIKTQQYEIEQLKLENELQSEQLSHKQALCEELEARIDKLRSEQTSIKRSKSVSFQLSAENKNQLSNRKRVADQVASRVENQRLRSKSLEKRDWQGQSDSEEVEANQNRNTRPSVSKSKEVELEILVRSSKRQLEQIASLEKECSLLREQLNLIEKERCYEGDSNDIVQLNRIDSAGGKPAQPLFGYKRKESSHANSTELRIVKEENFSLKSENFKLREKLDKLEFELTVKRGELDELKNKVAGDIEDRLNIKIRKLEAELSAEDAKCSDLAQTVESQTVRIKHLESKCSTVEADRMSYVEQNAKLSKENKKLYKKWFQLRKKETKFRQLLIQQIKIYCQNMELKKQAIAIAEQTKANNATHSNVVTKRSTPKKNIKTVTRRPVNIPPPDYVRKSEYEHQLELKTELEAKFNRLKSENDRITIELANCESKLKQIRLQNETYSHELASLRTKDREYDESRGELEKKYEESKEELKKSYELKLKTLTTDLNKTMASNKQLKSENEKLSDKLKVNNEKLNHLERDNNQKRNLLEFYKKKIEESSSVKFDLDTDTALSDYKAQIKKLSGSMDKLKEKVKALESEKATFGQKLAQSEKISAENLSKQESLTKEKQKLELTIKQYKLKVAELEEFIEKLEHTAETNIKSLSDTSKETLNLAQMRVTWAFKLADNYEHILKRLYDSLITYLFEIKKRSFSSERAQMSKKDNELVETMKSDANMKAAIDLASNLLNLSSNELDDILLTGSKTKNSMSHDHQDRKLRLAEIETDMKYEKKNLMQEFEHCLNASKKEKTSDSKNSDEDFENKRVLELIFKMIDQVIACEKKLIES